MPTYTVAVSNTSGVVLSYAPWTKATAAISAQDKNDIREGLATSTEISTRASQVSVNAIPTNPLLTTDGRLANLDAQISTRLPTSSYVAPANADVAAIKAKTDGITFTGANVNAISNVVADKTGYALTSAERTAIATAVEAALLNESDGQAILEAIVNAIGNSNVDEIALVAAIRADMERAGGMLDAVPTLAEINASTVLAKEATVATRASQTSVDAIPTNPVLSTDARISNLDAAVSSRLPTSGYTAPPSSNDNAAAVRVNLTTELGRINALPTLAEIAATTIDANIVKVNGVTVDGTGVEGDEWGPV